MATALKHKQRSSRKYQQKFGEQCRQYDQNCGYTEDVKRVTDDVRAELDAVISWKERR